MEKKQEYIICCKDGVISKGAQTGNVYWSWEYEQMDLYGKENPSRLAQSLLAKFLHDNEIGYELIFVYEDKEMKEIL